MTTHLAASDGSNGAGGLLIVVMVLIVAAMYFLPTIIAARRHLPNLGSVIVLNIFLGWTLIGWVASLAMAVSNTEPRVVINHVMPSVGPAPPPASGWYPDPSGARAMERFFNGQEWTQTTRPLSH